MGKAILVALVALLAAANAGQGPSDVEASARKVKELQAERIDAWKGAAEVAARLAQNGRLDISDALEDRMALLAAELDVAGSDSERIPLYKGAVESLRGLEDLAKAQKEAGRGTERSVLRIKARRLEIEIQLERAKIQGTR